MAFDINTKICLPEKYDLPVTPKPFYSSGDSNMKYEYTCGYNPGSRILTVNKKMTIEGVQYPASYYDKVRGFFLDVLNPDNDLIMVKQMVINK